ncbi:hypothetical protein DCC35_13795 [Mangrovivirga cuniculi]|uniref:Outer membrane protein beta-barrel domain-containing protein n=2 Tax=Mangrovivirga cuniculi TaxID=2715131 RepID=A0A4D7K8X4_9BACT|nr:hypothetical protein DCC35_13795 [Mangrovivirga cuniculi]
MKLHLILLTGFFLSIINIHAQTDFRPGYVITSSEDTLQGEIDYRGDLLMSKVCKFKNKSNNVTEFSPGDIIAYRFIDSKYYVSKEVNQKDVFLEYLIQGEMNIYYMRDESGDHYYIEKDNTEFTRLPYEEKIMHVDGKRVLYESTQHIGLLKYYTRDAPDFVSRVKTIKKPEHRNLIKLAEDYHNAVCKEEEKCIIYEKKLPLIKIAVTPYLGLTKYKGYDGFVNEIGGYLSFWAPRTSEKLFFKTGLIYNKLSEEEGEDITVYKIPLQVQYIFRAHRIQPNLSAGVNFLTARLNNYKEISHTLTLNAGLDYKIFKNAYLSTMLNSEFTPPSRVAVSDSMGFGLISYSFIVAMRFDL